MAYDPVTGINSPGGIYGKFGARQDGQPFQSAEEAQQYGQQMQARNAALAANPANRWGGEAYGGKTWANTPGAGANLSNVVPDSISGYQQPPAGGGQPNTAPPGGGNRGAPVAQQRGIDPATGSYYNRQPVGLNQKKGAAAVGQGGGVGSDPNNLATAGGASPMGNALAQQAQQRMGSMAGGGMGAGQQQALANQRMQQADNQAAKGGQQAQAGQMPQQAGGAAGGKGGQQAQAGQMPMSAGGMQQMPNQKGGQQAQAGQMPQQMGAAAMTGLGGGGGDPAQAQQAANKDRAWQMQVANPGPQASWAPRAPGVGKLPGLSNLPNGGRLPGKGGSQPGKGGEQNTGSGSGGAAVQQTARAY